MSAKVLFASNVICREIDPINAHFTNSYNKPIIRSLSGRWGRISANGDLYILEEIDIFSTQGGIENTIMITIRVQ